MPSPSAERAADVLLVVPPFATTRFGALGPHVLQACAREAGFRVEVLYANLAFAAAMDPGDYDRMIDSFFAVLPGERLFAPLAYGTPPVTVGHAVFDDWFAGLAPLAEEWVESVAAEVAAGPWSVVGVSTMFDQTAAGLALLRRVKELRPEVVTLLGGANCEEEMGEGLLDLAPWVDHVFSGESEETFIAFLESRARGERPQARLIRGGPNHDLDALPAPDFSEYYAQMAAHLPDEFGGKDRVCLVYETSRGCWWGQKHHCTFCGLNGLGLRFRQKSAERVVADLRELLDRHPRDGTPLVFMTDNIMPYGFFESVIPRLEELKAETPALTIFYEQKANLSLEQLEALKRAGVTRIQPGIESLSTVLLRRMDKGVTGRKNLTLLRHARALGIEVMWNLLWGFPGDGIESYEEILELIPHLHHLEPPSGVFPLNIDRFSPYFVRPEEYGVTGRTPSLQLNEMLPPDFDADRVAYHFSGTFESGSRANPEVIRRLKRRVRAWRARWMPGGDLTGRDRAPVLEVELDGHGRPMLRDTRGIPGSESTVLLTPEQLAVALVSRRLDDSPEVQWALDAGIAVVMDGHHVVPLATAEPDLVRAAEEARVRVGVQAVSRV